MFTAEAEAIDEHRACNVAHPDASAMIDEISVRVDIIINKRAMKEAMQWHVNITGARHTANALLLKHFIRNVSIQLVRLHLAYSGTFCLTFRHRASCILGQAYHCSPENAFYIFNQQIYFII